jgi:DNA-binding SARP family transcriptional activator
LKRTPFRITVLASVVLTLLGVPSVALVGSGPVTPPPGAKSLALLAYLAMEPAEHTREELAGLLWGESPEAEARASLRQVVKQLRTALGGVVRADRRTVGLAEPVECDACEFRRLVGVDPRAAVELDAPRFLSGFSVRHAPRFDEWVAETRGALIQRYTQALGALAREAMGQWRWRDAGGFADRWLATDPFSDEAVRLAIEARYLAGDRGAALSRFAEYRAALAREMGCEPSRALLSLVGRVEADAGQVTPRPITDEWYVRAPRFESSIVGRQAEWSELLGVWRLVRSGQGRIVLLEGEAGVGKSRLSEEFLRWVIAQGSTVLRGRGYDARAAVPYAPVVEALRGAFDAPGLAGTPPEWLAEAARVAPELRQRFPGLPEASAPADSAEAWRLFEAIAQVLAAVASERPVVVALDDLHWLDEDSCNLLRFLVRRLERAPLLWLGTLTLGELERDAPAARLCRLLRAKAHAVSLSLAPLGEEDVWRLIREMGHVSAPTGGRRFAGRIHRITGGNPFYIVELLKTMFAQGMLVVDEHSGEWAAAVGTLQGGGEFPLSRTVHDVIAERVARLPDELGELLITVAVAGGAGCAPEILSHVHGISRLHAAAVCDALAERRLVVEEAGAYRCAHPVIAHVVRDAISPPRRAEVHRILALTLELASSGGPGVRAGEIARHADRGGEPALAYRYALIASDAAVERYAYAEALSWLDLAAAASAGQEQAGAVNRRTADVLEMAGWREVPEGIRPGGPATREIVKEDLDLTVQS